MSNNRLFTLEEALALLPTARQLVIEIQAAKREFDALSADVERVLGLTGGNGHLASDVAKARADVQVSGSKLQGLMSELDSLGVQLKGIEEGLIDFPSERDGRIVLLCWRLGEETITWWHDEDTGFAGRRPL
jgi:hypothetical protein